MIRTGIGKHSPAVNTKKCKNLLQKTSFFDSFFTEKKSKKRRIKKIGPMYHHEILYPHS
jgi:hypothetical protein